MLPKHRSLFSGIPLVTAIVACSLVATAQPSSPPFSPGVATLVKDVNKAQSPISSFGPIAEFNGKILMTATAANTGEELWITDGPASTPQLLKDLLPGAASSVPQEFVVAGGKVFMIANSGLLTNGDVWFTDGTANGTVKIALPVTGTPHGLVKLGNGVAFQLQANQHENLFYTDGTPTGTVLIKQFAYNLFSFTPNRILESGGAVYVFGDDGSGLSLWKTDGSVAGTINLKHVSSAFPVSPYLLAAFNGKIYWADQFDIWRTDGTLGSSVIVTGQVPYINSSIIVGNKMYLEGSTGLWSMDANDSLVLIEGTHHFSLLTSLGAGVIMARQLPNTSQKELWYTDGTDTHFIDSLVNGGTRFDPFYAASFGSTAVVVGKNAVNVDQVWLANSSANSSVQPGPFVGNSAIDRAPVSTSKGVFWYASYDNKAVRYLNYFDGSAVIGSVQLPFASLGSNPFGFVRANNKVLFSGIGGQDGYQVWSTTGDAAGTINLQLPPNAAYGYQASLGDNAVVALNDGVHGSELWESDGTIAGTRLVSDTRPGSDGSFPNSLTTFKDEVVFWATEDGVSEQMRTFDGSGISIIKTVDRPLDQIVQADSDAFYFLTTSASGMTLTKSDGTALGTNPIAMFERIDYFNIGNEPRIVTRMGNNLFFVGYDASYGLEIRKLDLTNNSISLLMDITPGNSSPNGGSAPTSFLWLYVWNGSLYFMAKDPTHGFELWISDGTTAGTHLVKDINPGVADSELINFRPDVAVFGDKLYFPADDGVHGPELWSTQGTAASTQLVADLIPSSTNEPPFWFFVTHGRLLFSTDDKTLWEIASDDPQPAKVDLGVNFDTKSMNWDFFEFNDLVLFTGNTPDMGNELWALDYRQDNQLISFAVSDKKVGDPDFALTASFAFGTPTFSSADTSVIAISGTTAKVKNVGDVKLRATVASTAVSRPFSAEVTVHVSKGSQTIVFNPMDAKTFGDAPFTLTASATSGLDIAYSTASDKISITSDQVTLLKPGRTTVKAEQEGSSNYDAAVFVERSFCINPAKPVITESSLNTTSQVLTSSGATGNQWYLDGAAIANATSANFTVVNAGSYAVKVTADDCESVMSDEAVVVILGLENVGSAIALYPNPAKEYISVRLTDQNATQYNVELIDFLGRKMWSRDVVSNSDQTFDLHSASPGMYLIRIRLGGQTYHRQFVKD